MDNQRAFNQAKNFDSFKKVLGKVKSLQQEQRMVEEWEQKKRIVRNNQADTKNNIWKVLSTTIDNIAVIYGYQVDMVGKLGD